MNEQYAQQQGNTNNQTGNRASLANVIGRDNADQKLKKRSTVGAFVNNSSEESTQVNLPLYSNL